MYKNFFIFQSRPDLLQGPPYHLFNKYRSSFPKRQLPECNFGHSVPSSAVDMEQYLYSTHMTLWCGQGQPYICFYSVFQNLYKVLLKPFQCCSPITYVQRNGLKRRLGKTFSSTGNAPKICTTYLGPEIWPALGYCAMYSDNS